MSATAVKILTNAMVSGGNGLLREANRLFRPYGVTAAYFNVLNLLIDAPEGLRPSELTRSLVVDPSSTTYVLDQMEKRGWIKREREPADRRAYRVCIVAAGKRLHAQVAPLYQAALTEMAQGINERDAELVSKTILKVQHAAAAAIDRIIANNPPATSKQKASKSDVK
jgi:DNA-binding MarR family transcriptional regulator